MAFQSGRPTLKDLMNQLAEVSEWELLGSNLGIKKHKLNEIKEERRGKASHCRMDMLDYWLRSDVKASWLKLVQALEKMEGEYAALCQTLRVNHGLGQAPVDQSEAAQVHQPMQQGYSAGVGHNDRQVLLSAVQASGNSLSSNLARVITNLSKSNVDVNVSNPNDPYGSSVLQEATQKQDVTLVKALVALGANVNYVDKKNMTAFDVAIRGHSMGIADLLKSVGGLPFTALPEGGGTVMDTTSTQGEEEMRTQTQIMALCLDSSGDKAVVQLEVLNRIEKLTGRKISDLFEYVVGSGVGGLMLLAMVYGNKSVPQLQRLYYQYIQTLLNEPEPKKRWRAIEDFTHDLFGRTRMDDITSPQVLIGTVNRETTQLKLKFFNNFSSGREASIHVYRVACYTLATPEYFDVIGNDTDHHIHGGAICGNLTPSALTHIAENCGKPFISGVVSVGQGVWPARPFVHGETDLTAVAMDALMEQVHQNCKSQFTSPGSQTFYYRFNPLFPAQTPEKLLLEDLVDLHINTIGALVGEESSSAIEIKSLATQLSF